MPQQPLYRGLIVSAIEVQLPLVRGLVAPLLSTSPGDDKSSAMLELQVYANTSLRRLSYQSSHWTLHVAHQNDDPEFANMTVQKTLIHDHSRRDYKAWILLISFCSVEL